ncbi:MAG: hypothetical protein L6R38_009488 [Xanthoria sp. 2 TBL-2021]|nr:MAG: hypothetical protein L6R38_009488 [Xanthoria sp. 2 TBL-2021]
MSTAAPLLASIRSNWLPSLDPDRGASMGSAETQSDFEFKPVTLKEFETVFPQLVDDLSQHCKQYGPPEDALKWYQDSLNHNTMGGKCNRGMSVVDTTSILLQRPLSKPEFFHSATLGWLTELLQAFFLVSDDIMDSSQTRRGQPCWYRFPKVGMIAINDAFMLESSIYVLLRQHFNTHPSYAGFLEIFHTTTFQTEIGQLCDLLTAPEDHVDLNQFSLKKHSFIVIYKTAYYSFYLPVALALHYLSLATPGNLKQSQDILIPLGEYFQVQDDYLDAYGAPETIGKIGTDIMDNKCSWVINQALERASPTQRKILDECYGRKDAEKEAKVKEIFRELELEKVYLEYEEKAVGKIREMIAKVDESEGLRKGVFESFLKKIYKRNK